MTLKKTATLSAILLVGAGSIGFAAQPDASADTLLAPEASPPLFIFVLKNFDLDRDGRITPDEMEQGTEIMFETMDTNKNGFVNFREIRTWRDTRMGKAGVSPRSVATNTASTDLLSSSPKSSPAPATESSEEQQKSWTPDVIDKFSKSSKRRGGKAGGKIRVFLGPNPMTYMDSNNDKQLNLNEAKAGTKKLFNNFDMNGDSVISIDDFPG